MTRSLLPLLLVACSAADLADGADPARDTSTFDTAAATVGLEDDAACTARPVSLSPEGEVGPDAVVEAVFSEPYAGTLWIDGLAAAVAWSDDGLTARWTGLAEGADVALSAEACGVRLEARLSTTWRPIALDHPVRWAVHLPDLAWAIPMAAPALLRLLQVEDIHVRVIPTSYGLDVEAGLDDPCALTPAGSLRFTENPWVVMAPAAEAAAMVGQLEVSGRLTADGRLAELKASGLLDTREAALDGWCEAARGLGDSCVACDDGVEACVLALVTLSELPVAAEPVCP